MYECFSLTNQLLTFCFFTHLDVNVVDNIRSNFSALTTALSFDCSWIADEMYSNNLLSKDNHELITNIKIDRENSDKARVMLQSLEKKVELNEHHLSTFLKILHRKYQLYSEAIEILKLTRKSN